MERMVSFCGLLCNECPTFLATRNDDDVMRTETAERWSKEYKAKIRPKDINCDGCLSEDGKLFAHCHVCQIRSCGTAKGIENCAYCDEYPCDKLELVHRMAPDARMRLDKLREGS